MCVCVWVGRHKLDEIDGEKPTLHAILNTGVRLYQGQHRVSALAQLDDTVLKKARVRLDVWHAIGPEIMQTISFQHDNVKEGAKRDMLDFLQESIRLYRSAEGRAVLKDKDEMSRRFGEIYPDSSECPFPSRAYSPLQTRIWPHQVQTRIFHEVQTRI